MAYRCENKGGKLVYYKGNKLLTEGEVRKNSSIRDQAGQCVAVQDNRKKTKTKNPAEGYRCESNKNGLVYYDASGKIVPISAVPTAARHIVCSRGNNNGAKKSVPKKTPIKSKNSAVKQNPPKKGLYTRGKEKIKAGAKYVQEKVSPAKKKTPVYKGAKKTDQDSMPKPKKSPRQKIQLEVQQKKTIKNTGKTPKEHGVEEGYIENDVIKSVKVPGRQKAVEEEIVKQKVRTNPKTQKVEKHTGKTGQVAQKQNKPLPPLPQKKKSEVPPPSRPKTKSRKQEELPPPEHLPPPPLPPKSKTKTAKSYKTLEAR